MSYDPKRLPLIEPLDPRNPTIAKDMKMVNCLAEQSGSGTLRVVKRTGNHLAFTGTTGTGQGITNYQNNIYSISGDFVSSFASTSGLVATQATASASWSKREGMMSVGFAGKLWVMGGFMDPNLAQPTFTATINGSGVVTGIAITTNGSGYAPGYPATVNLTITSGSGSGATATVTMTGQHATSVNLTAGGSGYLSAPSVSVSTTAGWGVMNDIWSSADGVNWTPALTTAPWGQRGRGNALVFNGLMWITGGSTGIGGNPADIIYGDVWSSPDGVTWTRTAANAFPGRRAHGFTVFNNKMWVAGGGGLSIPSNIQYPNTFYSDVYSSSDGVTWVNTIAQAPWVARSSFAFFPANNLLWVVGGRMTDAFSTATGDSWSSPDGIVWTRVSSNPFGTAASTVWPVAAFNSQGMDFPIPPPITISGGTGGSGAAAYAFSDFDDDGDDDDAQVGPMVQLTFSNVGSGYTTAPNISFGTDVGFNANAYAFLNGTSNGGAKLFRSSQIGNTTYLFEFADGSTYVHTIWATTDGVTYTNLNVSFASGWVPRAGGWLAFGSLWMFGGIDTTPTYYNDVWQIVLGGVNTALSPNVAGGFYHFNQTSTAITTPLLVFKSPNDLYTYNSALNTLVKLSNAANYPATTVPGLVYLDGYFFVMDLQGRIWNSAINDASTWTALGVIAMQNEPNGGAAIAKLANFVVGFGVWTIEFFYDNANPAPASPLSAQTTLPIQIGCAAGESVVEMESSIVWVGQTKKEAQGVYWFNGYQPERISTPFIDRLIQNDPLTLVRAYGLDIFGHPCYVLYLTASQLVLVYDFTSHLWSSFTSLTPQGTVAVSSLSSDAYGLVTAVTATNHGYSDGDPVVISNASNAPYNGQFNISLLSPTSFSYQLSANPGVNIGTAQAQGWTSGPFKYVASAEVFGIDYVQDPTNGQINAQTMSDFTDQSNPVDLLAITGRWDAGNSLFKFITRISFVGDITQSIALISYSDNDYQSWGLYRTFDLTTQRPTVANGGRSRRRAYRLRHTAPTGFRGEALEFEYYLGDA